MRTMNITGELVEHGKYGFGRIESQSKKSVTIEFFDGGASMDFAYPACFAGEMRFVDPLAAKEFAHELSEPFEDRPQRPAEEF